MSIFFAVLMLLLLGLATVGVIALEIYGIYLSFKKKWYIGLASILFPSMALVVALAKLCKKDILKGSDA